MRTRNPYSELRRSWPRDGGHWQAKTDGHDCMVSLYPHFDVHDSRGERGVFMVVRQGERRLERGGVNAREKLICGRRRRNAGR